MDMKWLVQFGHLKSKAVPWLGTRWIPNTHTQLVVFLMNFIIGNPCMHRFSGKYGRVMQLQVVLSSVSQFPVDESTGQYMAWSEDMFMVYLFFSEAKMIHALLLQEDFSLCVLILHEVLLVCILSPFLLFLILLLQKCFKNLVLSSNYCTVRAYYNLCFTDEENQSDKDWSSNSRRGRILSTSLNVPVILA